MTYLKGYAESLAKITTSMPKFNEYHNWFLKNAKEFHRINETLSKKWERKTDAVIKQCYKNAFNAVHMDKSLHYYEGFVYDDRVGIPFEHAWAVFEDKVVDPTLSIRIEGAFAKRYGSEYMGIHIPFNFILERALATKKYGEFKLDWFLQQTGRVDEIRQRES